MEAQDADSRGRETGLSRKELEQSGTITQRQNLDKQLHFFTNPWIVFRDLRSKSIRRGAA